VLLLNECSLLLFISLST